MNENGARGLVFDLSGFGVSALNSIDVSPPCEDAGLYALDEPLQLNAHDRVQARFNVNEMRATFSIEGSDGATRHETRRVVRRDESPT